MGGRVHPQFVRTLDMDLRTLGKVFAEIDRLVPAEVRAEIATAVEKAAQVLSEAADIIDADVVDKTYGKSQSIYDDVRKDVGNPPGSFEDIVADFHKDNAGDSQPRAAGGSVDYSLSDVVDVVYTYLTKNHTSYGPWSEEHADWNRKHPITVLIDLLALVSDKQMDGNLD